VIDALALFASHLFDLASIVWNVVRELLTLSKRRMASRTSRLAPTFILGDLVFFFFKGLHIHVCDWRLGPFHVIDKVGLTLCKLEHYRGCKLLFGCNGGMLSKASFHQNDLQLITFLMLHWTLGLIIAVVHIFNV
jgi:hypothetical protein